MPFFKYKGIEITGVQTVVPDQEIQVSSFTKKFGDVAVEKFTTVTGIEKFYKAYEEQTASDLAFAAAEELLRVKKVNRDLIKALVFVTQSPDYRRPASSCVLQKNLGLSTDCAVFDVNLGCSGFVYGLQTICSMMQSSDIDYAILALGETATKLVNPNDQSIAMMFGDAGAALLIEKSDTEDEIYIDLHSDGSRYKSIILPAGGFRDMNPPKEAFLCSDGIERTLNDIFMNGTDVFSFSICDVPKTIEGFLKKTNMATYNFDVYLFHQANKFIIKQLIRKFNLPKDHVPLSLERYGNTGALSIPITLCDVYGHQNQANKKIDSLMCGFGIGLSWGVATASYKIDNIYPILSTRYCYKEGKILPGTL